WEPHLFKALCPGKERRVGRDEWLRRLLEAVEVFGRGNVNTHMVAGIELAQPYGFSEVGRAVESTSQGLDFLMEHGVLPTMQSWICEPGSSLAGHPLITLDYFIQIDRNWYQIWKEHGLPAGFMGPVGPGQATWALSAFRDMGSQATGELD
ncbi:MAG: radical SAM protein, partial [Dehalococcoidia bacterium]|nr:radical SAM protein [Dehalococcoidia bacterium]